MICPTECPNCKCSLEGQDICEYFIEIGNSREDAEIKASLFGWKKENKRRFNRVHSIYCMQEDRTKHWKCPDCGHVWDRL